MKKLLALLKWFLPIVLLVAIGMKLIAESGYQEATEREGYELYNAATSALSTGDFKAAYVLYLQSAYAIADPQAKANAFYTAANVGWVGQIADYQTLVVLYQQAIRNHPGFYEAAFNLEYLYWLKVNDPEKVPKPKPGAKPDSGDKQKSGEPGKGTYPPNGDI